LRETPFAAAKEWQIITNVSRKVAKSQRTAFSNRLEFEKPTDDLLIDRDQLDNGLFDFAIPKIEFPRIAVPKTELPPLWYWPLVH